MDRKRFKQQGKIDMVTPEDIRLLQKEIAMIIKEFRGAGAHGHSFAFYEDEMHILVNGTLTPVEKYLIGAFGQEYIDAIYKFYYETVQLSVKRLDDSLQNKYNFKLISWESDFFQDRMKYIIHYTKGK